MGKAQIPVDLFSPGQVFACVGMLEAADVLCGPAEGRFDWSETPRFELNTKNSNNPVFEVLEFLATVEVMATAPHGWNPEKGNRNNLERIDNYPAKEPDRMALPIVLRGNHRPNVFLSHWADGSSRDNFKLYAGNRSAVSIANSMLKGTANSSGKVKNSGVTQLWKEQLEKISSDPFGTLTAMGGSFNFDPRGAWTAINAGYSLNDQKHEVMASPAVEILAAWGLEHARPAEISIRFYRYAVWGELLPPQLARAALGGGLATIVYRSFRFPLDLSGKNKVVCYATEETIP